MANRRSTTAPVLVADDGLEGPPEFDPVAADAAEFGRHVRAGGWRLGLLVARCVEPSTGGRPAGNLLPVVGSKVSGTEFSRRSGVSQQTVSLYYRAWELAAESGMVQHASELTPGLNDLEDFEEDDERQEQWSLFYREAKHPKTEEKPKPKAQAKPKPKSPSKPKSEPKETPSKPEVKDEDLSWLIARVDNYLECMHKANQFAQELIDRGLPITDSDVIEKIKVASDLAARFPFEVNDLIVK